MPRRPAISSMSLGRAWVHNLPHKLSMAAKYGLMGIEMFYEDIEYFAKERAGRDPHEDDLIEACCEIKRLCDELDVEIIGLQPFMHYEGLTDSSEHEAMIKKMQIWFKLAKALGTDIIQIPTMFRPVSDPITGDIGRLVKDMREVADLGLQQDPVIKFAYENLCWGTFIDRWEPLWEVVEKVDRPNFGVCLDTFNITGRIWADPTSPDGKIPDADADLKASLERLKKIDVSKVWYIQVVGAERLEKPLVKGHEFYVEGLPARMCWSRNCRLFYGEDDKGQYLPIRHVTEVILNDLKYEGWVSMELFSRTMAEPGSAVPEEHAERASVAWKKLVEELKI